MQNSFFTASPLVESYLAPEDPHESQRIMPFGLLTLIVAIITMLVETYLVYLLLHDQISMAMFTLGHILVCGILLLLFMFLVMLPANRLFMALLLITTITIGPVGAAGVTVCMLMCLWYSSFATSFSEWFSTIFPSLILTPAERIDEDLRTGRDEASKRYSVDPFLDIIRYGTDDQKRRALSKVTSFFTPGFAPVLHHALADESNMIRVQAATAISIIDNRFQERLIKLSRLYEKHKNEPEIILALANFYDDYSFTGILDHEQERENRRRACNLYEEYLEKRANDGGVRTRYGRLLLRMHELGKAISCFEQSFESAQTATRASWLAEAYFRARNFERLRILAHDVANKYPELMKDMEDSVRHSFQSWAGQELSVGESV